MISIETEARVAKILLYLAESEHNIEINRKCLSDSLEFDPYQIFKILDKDYKNRIDICNIIDFLNYKEIYTNECEISLLIFFYDQDNDGSLSYPEFLNLIQSEKSIIKTNRNSNIKELPYNIEYSLGTLLEKEIELSRKLIPLLEELRNRNDFNIHNIFHLIKGYSSITPQNLRDFLLKNKANFIQDDVKSIMKRLDINHDGRIDLCEFHSFFGFPSCVNCCSINPCSKCGCCCCKECYCDPCYSRCNLTKKSESSKNIFIGKIPSNDLAKKTEDILNNTGLFNSSNNSTFYKSNILSDRYNNNDFMNPLNKKNINQNFSSSNCIPNYKFKENYIKPNYNQKIQKDNYIENNINPNLSLRLSPQRKYPPLNTCYTCKNNPCICPKNNYSPIKLPSNTFKKNNNNISEEKEEDNLLNKYLKNLMDAEKRIEDSKMELAMRDDFNCEDAFRIFEKNNKGFLTNEDLKNGLISLDIYATDSDVRSLMKRYDLNKKGFLNYVDFFDMIIPYEKDFRNLVENKSPKSCCACKSPDIFMFTTKLFLKNLFKDLIDYENKLNLMKKNYDIINMNLRDIFNSIDISNIGVLTIENLLYYLDKNGLLDNKKDGNLLFIRFDKNRDGNVDFEEFEDEFKIDY
jgi:Ca2+-binding EF-hand superfamily protein